MLKLIKYPILVLKDLILTLVIYLPGATGNRVRSLYYRQVLKSMGEGVVIDTGVHISSPELISIGNNVHIDKGCIIATGLSLPALKEPRAISDFSFERGEIVIGNDVHICQGCILMGYGGISLGDKFVMSAGSKVYSMTNVPCDRAEPHKVTSLMPYSQAIHLVGPVTTGPNVWLGLHCIVMPGVHIGENSFCASNSVVTSNLACNSHAAGQPAVMKKFRFSHGK